MEKHYDLLLNKTNVKTQMRVNHTYVSCGFTNRLCDRINKYIDDELIPLDENYGKVKGNAELQHSYSKGLVGQIRQDEKSAQLDCKILDETDDVIF